MRRGHIVCVVVCDSRNQPSESLWKRVVGDCDNASVGQVALSPERLRFRGAFTREAVEACRDLLGDAIGDEQPQHARLGLAEKRRDVAAAEVGADVPDDDVGVQDGGNDFRSGVAEQGIGGCGGMRHAHKARRARRGPVSVD